MSKKYIHVNQHKIRSNLKEVFDQSARSRTPTNEVADSMARAMLSK